MVSIVVRINWSIVLQKDAKYCDVTSLRRDRQICASGTRISQDFNIPVVSTHAHDEM